MSLRPGDILGRYQILCPIGAGGMASVFAARVVGAESFEKRVALKVMLPHLSRDPKFVKMFGDEARVAAQIQSAYVASTLDLGRDEVEGLYQVMELVVGGSLRQVLDGSDEPLPVDVALSLLGEVARGLADAHAARGVDGAPLDLVHRDVSPHNVLVGVDGRARLTDFGVAKAKASVSATESGELKGKLAYAAPEQLRGELADVRSDVFALGIVLWETLAGRRLFVAENPLALVDAVTCRPIPRLDDVRPEVGAAVADLVGRALERDRSARTVTAMELATGLAELARERADPALATRIGEIVRARCGEPLVELERRLTASDLPPSVAVGAAPALAPRAPRAARSYVPLALGLVGIALALALAARVLQPAAVGSATATSRSTSTSRSTPTPMPSPTPSPVAPEPEPDVEPPAQAPAPTPAIDVAPTPPRRRDREPPAPLPLAPAPPAPEREAPPPAPAPPPSEDGLLGIEDFDRGEVE